MKTNKKKSHYYTIVFTDGGPQIVFTYGKIVSNSTRKMATHYIETYFN